MIDRELLRDVPQGYWDERTVAETMLPAAHIGSISPATPVSTLLPRLLTDALWQRMPMPVVDQGQLVGLIDGDQMSEILELEDEFGLFGRGAVAEAHLDEVVMVDDARLLPAMRFLLDRAKLVAEPSGAITVAALMDGIVKPQGPTVAICSGGNMEYDGLT